MILIVIFLFLLVIFYKRRPHLKSRTTNQSSEIVISPEEEHGDIRAHVKLAFLKDGQINLKALKVDVKKVDHTFVFGTYQENNQEKVEKEVGLLRKRLITSS